MKKLLPACALIAALACGQTASAQLKPFSFGPYAEIAFPTGKMAETSTVGYGAGFGIEARLPVSLAATASIGLMHFGGADIQGTTSAYQAINAIPIRIGAKYRFSALYLALESGVVIPTRASERSTGLLAPAIGVRFLNIDVRAKYESWLRGSDRQFWGLQASLRF